MSAPTTKGYTPDNNGGDPMQRLLARVHSRGSQVAAPATTLKIEVDGEVIGISDTLECPLAFDLPRDARSVTLKDGAGNLRAHVLLQEQPLDDLVFDQGRLALSVQFASSLLIVRYGI